MNAPLSTYILFIVSSLKKNPLIVKYKENDIINNNGKIISVGSGLGSFSCAGVHKNEFKNAKQVVIDFSGVEYDKNAICKDIHEYLPDVEVYDVVHVTGQDYIEKCR